MSNSKIDFISNLLANKDISAADKERLFLLTNEEMKKMDIGSDEVLKRLNEVEENIVKRLEEQEINVDIENHKYENDSSIHKKKFPAPKSKSISDFLSLVNQRDGLKNFDKDGVIEVEKFFKEQEINEPSENHKPEHENNLNKKKLPAPANNPKNVADFMSLFNQRDGLKYLTHDFDEDGFFDIDNYLEKSKEIFLVNTKMDIQAYQNKIPINLWRILNQFAFEKDPKWFSYNSDYANISIKEGWTTDKWINWSKENELHPIRNAECKEIINCFRRVTRIEAPQLKNVIDNIIEAVLGDEKKDYDIDLIKLDKADFYTHVPSFRKALESIFKEIKNRTDTNDKRKITIKYDRDSEGEYFIRKIVITHFSSFPDKELDVLCKEWQSSDSKGTMGGIRNNVIGYCYWSVETKIDGKAVRVNILRDSNTPEVEEIDEANVSGFTHILTFYYK